MVNKFNNIYKGRKVFITGHTGFKGSWICLLLHKLGADVYGYALDPPTNPSLFIEANVGEIITSTIGDIRDYKFLLQTIKEIQPEIIIHMAAQPLVMESYKNPRETYEINVMGTVNIFESARQVESVKVILNITTDKCYENKEWHWGYRENEPMGGYDPYSSSKGCSELITGAFRNSYFNIDSFEKHGIVIASARAGNVIGGGDWAADRLIPDFIRSIIEGEQLKIRNPYSIRPWQHVLEPLSGYITLVAKMSDIGIKYSGAWNFGPDDRDAKNVEWITNKLCELWGNGISYEIDINPQPHEASYLKLDCSKANNELLWFPKWNIEKAIELIIEWNKAWLGKGDIRQVCIKQIEEYFNK